METKENDSKVRILQYIVMVVHRQLAQMEAASKLGEASSPKAVAARYQKSDF